MSALVHVQRGALVEAEQLARDAVAEARKTDSPELQAASLADLGEVLQAAKRRQDATMALREALELYERKGIIPHARRTRERLAELEGHCEMSTDGGVSPAPIS